MVSQDTDPEDEGVQVMKKRLEQSSQHVRNVLVKQEMIHPPPPPRPPAQQDQFRALPRPAPGRRQRSDSGKHHHGLAGILITVCFWLPCFPVSLMSLVIDHFHDAVAGTKIRFTGALAAIRSSRFFPDMRSKALFKC